MNVASQIQVAGVPNVIFDGADMDVTTSGCGTVVRRVEQRY
jgi:hypothetical protein